jgi:nicotinate phosphoribosyltransferase
VRLDSGTWLTSRTTYGASSMLGGLHHVHILASGNLDDEAVRTLVSSGAPIDDFAIGTRLDTSADAPYPHCPYKLGEYAGRARRKRSTSKPIWPGRKQVYRRMGQDDCIIGDILTLESDPQAGEPSLRHAMRSGQHLRALPTLQEVRQREAVGLARLPEHLRQLQVDPPYPVSIAQSLHNLAAAADRQTSPARLP